MSKKREFLEKGFVVNPTPEHGDPMSQLLPYEEGIKFFRFRSMRTEYFLDEVSNAAKGRYYASPISSQNDYLDGLPVIDYNTLCLSEVDVSVLQASAASAILELVGVMTFRKDIHSSKFTVEWIADYAFSCLRKYFRDEIFQGCISGDKRAFELALTQVRSWIRILCMSSIHPNSYYWGHYGDSGSGVAFEIEDRFDRTLFSPVVPVEITYSERRPLVSGSDILVAWLYMKIIKNWQYHDLIFSGRNDPFLKALSSIAFAKESATWSQEKEWRLIDLSGSKGGYVARPGLHLKRIIFGPMCSQMKIEEVMSKVRSKNPMVGFGRTVIGSDYHSYVESIE